MNANLHFFTMLSRLSFLFIFFLSKDITANDYPFDRLFTSVAERNQLDNARFKQEIEVSQASNNQSASNKSYKDIANIVNKGELVKKGNKLKLSGVVVRPDGKKSLWINGKLSSFGVQPDGAKNTFDSAVISTENTVILHSKNKQKRLKAGQIWISSGNQVIEGFEHINKEYDSSSKASITKSSIILEAKKIKSINSKLDH